MKLPTVYLIVSGAPDSLMVFSGYLELTNAQSALEGVAEVSGKAARIVPIILSDPQLLTLLDTVDLDEHEYAAASKLDDYRVLRRAAGKLERIHMTLINYLLNIWKGFEHENQHDSV